MQEFVVKLREQLSDFPLEKRLDFFLTQYQDRIALASSLGAEDQVLTDLVLNIKPDARIFILDTGRLHQETYDTLARTRQHYRRSFEVYFPETAAVETMVSELGPDLFYESVKNRKRCCEIRKVQPLQRVLDTVDVWITGLRREQAVTRVDLEWIEWDATHQKIKLNPLRDWSTEAVWNYLRERQVPYNALHDLGYPSIGCAPCTRAVEPGEDLRAGRWWWEEPEHKECGLHIKDGKVLRRCQP